MDVGTSEGAACQLEATGSRVETEGETEGEVPRLAEAVVDTAGLAMRVEEAVATRADRTLIHRTELAAGLVIQLRVKPLSHRTHEMEGSSCH